MSKAVSLPRSINEIYISVGAGTGEKKDGTEIITLHSALGFNTFLIKVCLAGWITTVILDALLIKASHAGNEKTLHFIIIFA